MQPTENRTTRRHSMEEGEPKAKAKKSKVKRKKKSASPEKATAKFPRHGLVKSLRIAKAILAAMRFSSQVNS